MSLDFILSSFTEASDIIYFMCLVFFPLVENELGWEGRKTRKALLQ